jgi:hypothetical protein
VAIGHPSHRETIERMSKKDLTPLDRQGLLVGDRVQTLANPVKAPVGIVGTIVGFSAGSHHPLVQIAGRGRFLIPALSLVRCDQAAERSPR